MKATIFAWVTMDIDFDTIDEARKYILDNQDKYWHFEELGADGKSDFWADKYIRREEPCNGLKGDVTGHTYMIEVRKPYNPKINAGW